MQRGLTLVEVLITIVLLLGMSIAILTGVTQASIHADYLSQFKIALSAAEGELERLLATPFDSLANDAEFAPARPPSTGLCVGIGEDGNCNGQLDAGEDRDGNGRLADPLQGGRLGIQLRTNPANPNVLELHVASCWQHRGRRLGEDQNCNGALDPGEDTDGDGWMDSPAMVSTQKAQEAP